MQVLPFVLRLFILYAFAANTLLRAQPSVDILQIRYDLHIPSPYDDIADAGAEKRSLRQVNVRWLAPLPVYLGSDTNRLLIGGEYANFSFRSHADSKILQQSTFQWLELHFGYIHNWNTPRIKQTTRFIFIPKWSTDGPLFRDHAFQYGGLLIHKWQLSERLALGIGGYYFRETFGWNFLPAFEVDWRMRNDWFLYGTLLGNMRLVKMLNDRHAVSASFWGPGNSIHTKVHPGSYVRIVEGLYSIWKLDWTWYFSAFDFIEEDANTYIRFSFGYSFDRKLALYDAGDNELKSGVFYPYGDGPFASVTLAMRVRN